MLTDSVRRRGQAPQEHGVAWTAEFRRRSEAGWSWRRLARWDGCMRSGTRLGVYSACTGRILR